MPTSPVAQILGLKTPDASLLGGKSTILFYDFRIKGIFSKSLRCLVKCLFRTCMCGAMRLKMIRAVLIKGSFLEKVCFEFLSVSSERCTVTQRWKDIPGNIPENLGFPTG